MLTSPISTTATVNTVEHNRVFARYKNVQGVLTKNGMGPDQSIWNETTSHSDAAPHQLVLSRTEPKSSTASYGRSKLNMKITRTVSITGPDGVTRPMPYIIEVIERCPVGMDATCRATELALAASAITDSELGNFFTQRYL